MVFFGNEHMKIRGHCLKCQYKPLAVHVHGNGCSDGSPMDIDAKGDCFNCFPFHELKLGNVRDFKEVNPISEAQMSSKFLITVFEANQVKEPCASCPHYMVRCSSGCFAYNHVSAS